MSYTKEEIENFNLFVEKANKLWLSSFINDVKKLSFTLNYEQNKGVSSKTNLPPEEIIESLLVRYRHFYMEKSPIKLERILSILYHNSGKKIQAKVSEIKRNYRKALTKSPASIRFNEKTITPKEIIEVWLYGEHFHLDKDKREIIKRMQSMSSGLGVFFLLIPFHRLIACIKITSEIIENEILKGQSLRMSK